MHVRGVRCKWLKILYILMVVVGIKMVFKYLSCVDMHPISHVD